MKNNKTIMKIISVCFIFVLIFNITGNIYAAVNTSYGTPTEVVEPDLEGKLKNSTLLEAIASLIYALGSLVENLVGIAFELLTGANMFPWADKVIFNTIPFLDVNFLNPAKSSLFLTGSEQETQLAKIVRNLYFTVLIIAIGFLGIIVGIMAIRLAISTIAAEKAKYKQAIAKFLVSLVMLFCVHYAISFIFYVNESLVEMASDILVNNTVDMTIDLNTKLEDETIITNFFKKQETAFTKFQEEKDEIFADEQKVSIMADLLRDEYYKRCVIPMAYGSKGENWFEENARWLVVDTWSDNDTAVERVKKDVNDAVNNEKLGLQLESYNAHGPESYIDEGEGSTEFNEYMNDKKEAYKRAKLDAWDKEHGQDYAASSQLGRPTDDDLEAEWENHLIILEDGKKKVKATEYYREYYLEEILPPKIKLIQIKVNAVKGLDAEATTKTVIAELGQYFKENAWTYEVNDEGEVIGWDTTELSLQGALLYAIFVVQSMLYFVAYIKRFFYVVILALLAPVVVIYDFLGKAIM